MTTYRRRQHTLDAIKLTQPMTIQTDEKTLQGAVGDWLCSDGRRQWFMADAEFRRDYEAYTSSSSSIAWNGVLPNLLGPQYKEPFPCPNASRRS